MKLFVFVCIIAVALAKRNSVLEEFLEEFLRDVTEERVAYRKCGADEHNPYKCDSDKDCCGDDICKEKKNMFGKVLKNKKCTTPCYDYDYDNCKKVENRKDCLRGPERHGPRGTEWWYQKQDKIYKVKGQCYKALTGCTGCLYDPSKFAGKHLRKIESGCGALCKGGKFYKDVGDSCGGGDSLYVKNPSGSKRNKCCPRDRVGLGSVKGGNHPEITCCKDKAVEDVKVRKCVDTIEEELKDFLNKAIMKVRETTFPKDPIKLG